MASGLLACSGVAVKPDAVDAASDATADAGADAGSLNETADSEVSEASACTPELSGTPSWSPSTGYPMSVCTNAAVAALITDCFTGSPPDPAMCAVDLTTYADCYKCGFTAFGQASLGPFVVSNDLIGVNGGECIDLITGVATGCAEALGVAANCTTGSCLGCTHPIPEAGIAFFDAAAHAGDSIAFDTCAMESIADGGVCATFESTALSACTDYNSPCLEGSRESRQAYLERIFGYFCGPNLYDAGAIDAGAIDADGAAADATSD
jgi:hypothetical protein